MARQDALDGHPSERLAIVGQLARQFRSSPYVVRIGDAASESDREKTDTDCTRNAHGKPLVGAGVSFKPSASAAARQYRTGAD
jgi:hypothetical protein